MQQMTASIHNGNADSPFIFLRFGLRCGGNGLNIGQFEGSLSFHKALRVKIDQQAYRSLSLALRFGKSKDKRP
jgi:hypothetical protein